MDQNEIRQLEINLLLEAIFQRYGYDFRLYAKASIERRIQRFLSISDCATVSDLIPRILNDEHFFLELAQSFSVSTTEMFRDPFVYRMIRQEVIPLLKTWPHLKIWHAGCATGEEVYSLAILLMEEGLYDRVTIFATDFNDAVLDKAKKGIYELDRIRAYSKAYQEAGGKTSLSDYYHARYEAAALNGSLKKNITFANHNLTVDRVFGDMHLVFCRNVLIYFTKELQSRALGLFAESLVHGGFLCLGTKESLQFSEAASQFEEIDRKAKLYKRVMVS